MQQTLLPDIKAFLDEDFLLNNRMARVLYHDYARHQPIIDYHNHLPPDEIAQDKAFPTITQAWLQGDHYKWRAMRTFGIDEAFITGEADDQDKFLKWAETVPYTIRNPLFHWTHLELQRYFDIDELLFPGTAPAIYQECNRILSGEGVGAQGLLQKMNVEVVCTTDDPIDSLAYHQIYQAQQPSIQMYPAFRPDRAIQIQLGGYNAYIDKLGEQAGIDIRSYDQLLEALQNRIDFFHTKGCRLSDHGLSKACARSFSEQALQAIFTKRRNEEEVPLEEAEVFTSGLMHQLGQLYAEKGWVMQLHLGALRNANSRLTHRIGPNTGFDSIGDFQQAADLATFLDRLDAIDQLPKTILYNLNPRDNEVMASMIGNFNDGSVRGKIQFGSAWWFLDQKDGMEKQINTLSNMGLLSCFVGMLTDSRSFLSFPRHEYFRRILCNIIGKEVHQGELPCDERWLGGIVSNICYHNAKAYFGFGSPA